MRADLIILPFLALFIAALGAAVKSKYTEIAWIAPSSYVLALALIIAWISWDIKNFKRFIHRKGAKFGASSGITVLLVVLIIVGIANLSTRSTFNASVDVSRSGSNTLSDQSLKVIAKVKESAAAQPINAVAYFQDPAAKTTFKDLLGKYLNAGAELKVEYVDPQKNPTRAIADKITTANTVIIQRGDLESRLATFTEEKLTNALVKVLKDKSKTIYFTSGHGEGELRTRSANSYDIVVQELENNKYKSERLNILETGSIPDDADLVIIAGPKYDLREGEINLLRAYLLQGKALMVMLDAVTKVDNLAALLAEFGIEVKNDLLLLPPNDPRAMLLGQNNALVTEFDAYHSVTKDFSKSSAITLLMPNTRSLNKVENNLHKMSVQLVASTSSSIVRLKGVADETDLEDIGDDRFDSGRSFPVIAVATGKDMKVDPHSEHGHEGKDEDVTSESAEVEEGEADKKKQIKLLVTGSSHFARNQGAQTMIEHRDMFVNMTNFMLEDEDFISLRPKDITKSSISLNTTMSHLLLFMICYLYPCVFLGSGIVHWIKRRSM